uniref:Galectin n=1 Tax=Heterorhabditis bacteriophora TaxID=37862 RepID=A0A1I7WQW0_HETBA
MRLNYSTFQQYDMSGPPDLLDIPGKRLAFTSGSDEEIRLGSRVTFNDQSVNIEGCEYQVGIQLCSSNYKLLIGVTSFSSGESHAITFHEDEHSQNREQWDNKKNGGGIYIIMINYKNINGKTIF